MSMSDAIQDLKAILDEHADCDYTKRVPSGLESLDPEGVRARDRRGDGPVVVKFGKDFCGWTKKLNRALVEIVPNIPDRANFTRPTCPLILSFTMSGASRRRLQ